MDLEELTKTQIVLLTLLITFVTSIATGIVTVSLMQQAPPAVTKTINRVVERTIERVVPSDIEGGKETIVIEKEVTVVVKEDDLITDSINQNSSKIVRLYLESETSTTGSEEEGNLSTTESPVEESFVGLGIIVSSDGLIATSRTSARAALSLKVVSSNGEIFDTKIENTDEEYSTGLLRIVLPEEVDRAFSPVTFMGDDSIKLGQTVIALSGKDRTNVSIGIVSDLVFEEYEIIVNEETGETSVVTKLESIDTNLGSKILSGSPIINIFGEVIGIKTSLGTNYAPINVIESQIDSISISVTENTDDVEVAG